MHDEIIIGIISKSQLSIFVFIYQVIFHVFCRTVKLRLHRTALQAI